MAQPTDDVDLLKKQKEVEKLEVDLANAKASIHWEPIKAWASLLAPVMTAATVLGTVWIGYLQISTRANSDEDANWRQTINSIDAVTQTDLSARHVGTLLKPFLESKRYRTAAIGVTISEFPKLRDYGTFKELFETAFPDPSPIDLLIILDIDRRLYTEQAALAEQAAALAKQAAALAKQAAALATAQAASTTAQAASTTAQAASTTAQAASTMAQAASKYDDERQVVLSEVTVLCDPIARILRNEHYKTVVATHLPKSKQSSAIPLNNITFYKCNLSGINFSNTNLANSDFSYANLDDTVLVDQMNDPENQDLWNGTVWWHAKSIDLKLLTYLLTNSFKPYAAALPGQAAFTQQYWDDLKITEADWMQNIRRLCKNANLKCTDEQIRVDFPKSSGVTVPAGQRNATPQ